MSAFPPDGRIVIRSPNWLGDVVMTLPAINALRRAVPAARLTVLAAPKIAPLWERITAVDSVLRTDPNLIITADALKEHRFDAALILPNSLRTGLEPWLAGIPVRVGFTGPALRRHLLTHSARRLDRTRGWRHQSLDYFELLKTAAVESDESSSFALPEGFVFASPLSPHPRPYLAVCPGAEYGPAKRWPAEHFAATAAELCRRHGYDIVLLGADGDRPVAELTAGRIGGSGVAAGVLNLAGETTLDQFIDWLAHASSVLSNDSGAMHLAALFGRPGAVVFGSTEPRLTGPITPSLRVYRHHVPCGPCFLRHCPRDFRCMTSITPEDVLAGFAS